MRSRRRPVHPDDTALLALVDDADGASETDDSAHVATCAACAERVRAFRQTRSLLESIADLKDQPRRDLAQRALGSLRLRHGAIGNINEVLAALRTLLAGFAQLFGGVRPSPPPRSTEGNDES